jgi:hypothetical protein
MSKKRKKHTPREDFEREGKDDNLEESLNDWPKQPQRLDEIIKGRWHKFLEKRKRQAERAAKRRKKIVPDDSFGD